jgi:acetylxylan esterase
VVIHSCQSSAQAYFQNSLIPWHGGSDKKGYITIWPSSPNSGTCWDVSSKATLTHNGGGDSNAIANMVTYAITKYSANVTRVFATGGSSGGMEAFFPLHLTKSQQKDVTNSLAAMMSNVLAATYPELFQAVSLYSGVAAGCFVSSSVGIDQWNNTCSGGQVNDTPQKWGDVARAMYPGYNGTRPRMQFWHGSADTTLAPQNYQEELKQWTNVFNVSQTATSSQANTPDNGYTTSNYGPNVQGIYAQGVGHSVPAHLAASEAWFGL